MCNTDRYAPTFLRSDEIAMYIVATVVETPTNTNINNVVLVKRLHERYMTQL
jgi:hypothetical protein